jgi:peptide/nickel transport system substrate-binding protein
VKQKLSVLVSLVVLASLVLSACGGGGGGAGENGAIPFPEGGKSVTGAWSQEPDNIVPYFTQMSYAIWIAQLTLVGLAEWDENGNFVPELAAEIPSAENGGVSPDGLTITWKLKEGLKWSDGEPLTSADVKFTWEAVMDPANVPMTKFGYEKIESIETPDDTTVVIKFSELFPPWQVVFTQGPNNSGAILPKHILEGKTALESDPFIHQPTIASGPFVITEWVPGDHMTLLPNVNFYKGRPKLDQVQIKFVPTPETALAALQTGDVDWYPDFSESDIETVGALEPAVHLKVVPGADFEHYFFNLGTTEGVDGKGKADQDGFCPFKDVKVRKAITLGVDRQAFVDSLLAGKTTVPATQWPNSEWENKNLKPDAYDPDAAMALLEEAGYTDTDGDGIREGKCDGEDVKLSFRFDTTDKQIRVDIALAVQSDLKKIGIEFKPNHTPAGTFFAGYTDGGVMPTGNYDMAGYTTGFYPDPMQGVIDSYACDAVPNKDKPSGANNYLICDPKVDELLAAVNATADPAGRKAALDELQQYIFDQYYVVMMYARANVYGYVDRFVPGPFGFFSNMNWNAEVWDVKE